MRFSCSITETRLLYNLLLLSLLASLVASGCYSPNNDYDPDQEPCSTDGKGTKFCCAAGDMCLSNGVCNSTTPSEFYNTTYYRGGCYHHWDVAPEECPRFCVNAENTYENVSSVNWMDLCYAPAADDTVWLCHSPPGGSCPSNGNSYDFYLATLPINTKPFTALPLSSSASTASADSSSSTASVANAPTTTAPANEAPDATDPATPPTETSNGSSSGTKSTTLAIGIGVGVGVGLPFLLALGALAAWLLIRRRKGTRAESPPPMPPSDTKPTLPELPPSTATTPSTPASPPMPQPQWQAYRPPASEMEVPEEQGSRFELA